MDNEYYWDYHRLGKETHEILHGLTKRRYEGRKIADAIIGLAPIFIPEGLELLNPDYQPCHLTISGLLSSPVSIYILGDTIIIFGQSEDGTTKKIFWRDGYSNTHVLDVDKNINTCFVPIPFQRGLAIAAKNERKKWFLQCAYMSRWTRSLQGRTINELFDLIDKHSYEISKVALYGIKPEDYFCDDEGATLKKYLRKCTSPSRPKWAQIPHDGSPIKIVFDRPREKIHQLVRFCYGRVWMSKD